VNNKDIGPANVQNRPMKEEDVGAVAVIDRLCLRAPRLEYYREKLGSATKGARINTSLGARARTTMLQAECKR